MTNMSKSFTYDEYRGILSKLKQKYDLVSFSEANKKFNDGKDGFSVIRHDVDAELGKALTMALIEKDMGVSSTYFFLISTDTYNLLSGSNRKAAQEILKLGHEAALHFDPTLYEPKDWTNRLAWEKSVLQEALGTEIQTVSFHKHASYQEGFEIKTSLLETTKAPFFNNPIKYFADSRGRWRFGHPIESEAFREGKPMHLSFHPIWWGEEPEADPKIKLAQYIVRRDKFHKELVETEFNVES